MDEEKEVMWQCIRCECITYSYEKPDYCKNCNAYTGDIVLLEDSEES
ncbi:hypothetical protein J4436_03640 [Candidatus Woesearchaeota archaeon]|nr:hypothetical protein [Candidatus Woesearchaeota archaeon]